MPGLAELRRAEPARVDWAAAEARLGTLLPCWLLTRPPGGLLTWGSSNQGDTFLWTTEGTGPEAWKVTVASRSGDWWHYDAGALQFTADLISGALEPWGLPRVRPEVVALGGEGQTGERAPQADGG